LNQWPGLGTWSKQCLEVSYGSASRSAATGRQFSAGGFRKRSALASALVAEPDVLLLEMNDHHLDAQCIEWLQNQLSA